jgi:SHS2 domain-containing protein
MLVANPDSVRPLQDKHIVVEASEPAYLMFDWLSELLFAFESERLLIAEFDIRLEVAHPSYRLTAHCRGEPMDESRHHMDHLPRPRRRANTHRLASPSHRRYLNDQ